MGVVVPTHRHHHPRHAHTSPHKTTAPTLTRSTRIACGESQPHTPGDRTPRQVEDLASLTGGSCLATIRSWYLESVTANDPPHSAASTAPEGQLYVRVTFSDGLHQEWPISAGETPETVLEDLRQTIAETKWFQIPDSSKVYSANAIVSVEITTGTTPDPSPAERLGRQVRLAITDPGDDSADNA